MSAKTTRAARKIPGLFAFQGERGAFSEEACRKLLGPEVGVMPCVRFEELFQNLRDGRAAGAIVPIENTLAGSVHENYDHLVNFELPIVAETSVRIVHNLMAPKGVPFSKIKRVFSHPVALNQCLDFFARNPQIERTPFYDTAGSVKMVIEEGLTDAGAIASAVAAGIYGARILRRSIESDRQNFTRFFLLRTPDFARRNPTGPALHAAWKTSLVFTTKNVPGALFRALSAFALRDLSLTKIESRPLRGKPWEYLFYLDFLGRADSPNAQNALNHLREIADFIRVLGCYPKGA
ncbi:MAG TPA: prephenate dehydratase domain-containing protein [Candidatus Acidoferrales bacterium]|nr:prephenate dehydratase domain-containing protein [Candidatus Acidoferrales bacterium]